MSTTSVAEGTPSATCRRFSLPELERYFNPLDFIAQGGFGKVYKGKIDNGQQTVAIKRLSSSSKQGEDEFLTEIEMASMARHVNLASLIGYCNDDEEMILVYEYIPNGTLSDHLYRSRESSALTWRQRLIICIGAARGINYLHIETHPSIIHRDLKSTNILLDEYFTAKVSDFGLAKHITASKTHVTTVVKGTYGYYDLSYYNTGKLTKNSDTYAFGVVLLEALTGIPPRDIEKDGRGMVTWAKDKISKGKAEQIVALNLRNQIPDDCLKTFVGIALKCLSENPTERPTMAQVVAQLELALLQQQRKATSSLLSCYNISGSDNTPSNAVPIDELRDITYNFKPDRVIREAYGQRVYHGELSSGQAAEIIMIHHSFKREAEFLAQVSKVSSLKHENVAQLLGYCLDGDRRFIAYEFAVNGPLNEFLQESQLALSWGQRVKIAMGVAKGLVYIHKKSQIHCNFGPNSVLVYGDNVAKLAYFYHSTFDTFDDEEDNVEYDVYLPPEYGGELSWRSDVYGFGMILLQLVTGRKPSEIRPPPEDTNIMDWIKDSVDARLHGDYPEEEVVKVAETAVLCLQRAESRPSISVVVRALRPLLND